MSQSSKPRVHLLDEIRGLSILLMVAYHAAYDLVYIFGVSIPAFHWPILGVAQPFVAGVFIFISGVACRYSRSNRRRGLIALGLGIGVSLVTWVFMPGQMIWFGILHFMGTSMVLYSFLYRVLDRVRPGTGVVISGLLYLFTVRVPRGVLGFPGLWGMELPRVTGKWLLPLGLGGSGADYFPLLPWVFVFFAGAYAGRWFVEGKMPKWMYRSHFPWLAAVGRRTILIYILHQPVVYGVLWVVFWLIRSY